MQRPLSHRHFIEYLVCAPINLMMTTLCKKLSHHLPFCGLRLRLLSTVPRNPPLQAPFIVSYLVDTFGFTPETASKAFRSLAHIKSPARPDKVVHFLKQSGGLSDAHIRTLISKDPGILCANVDTTLKPKLRALQQLGFSDQNLHRLIILCPYSLACDLRSNIEFWRDFYRNNVDSFFKAVKRDPFLLTTRFDTRIDPSLAFLRLCGLSNAQIAKLILKAPRLITRKVYEVEALIRRAENLGVPRGSGMFLYALCTVNSLSDAKIDSKVENLRRIGCSVDDIECAVQKYPPVLVLSEKKIRDCMEFFMERVGCEASYVLRRPVLLTSSLERKLIPRNQVLQIIWSKKLARSGSDIYNAMITTEKKFLEKYVLPYKEMVPGLYETYIAAFVGKVDVDPKHQGSMGS